MKIKNPKSDQGFTIVELMISMAVLSTILIMSTIIIIQIGSLYTKGVNSSNLQNANRTIMADVSSSLQFSGNDPAPCTQIAATCYANPSPVNSVYAFCIGNTRYSYVLDKELGTDSNGVTTLHVLWRDTMPTTASCMPLDLTQANPTTAAGPSNSLSGYEMMPQHMSLTRFMITQNPTDSSLYNIDVWMAYGDSDLVMLNPDNSGAATCSGAVGTQFCAISSLSTTVTRRIE